MPARSRVSGLVSESWQALGVESGKFGGGGAGALGQEKVGHIALNFFGFFAGGQALYAIGKSLPRLGLWSFC